MVASSLSGLMLIWPDLGLHGFRANPDLSGKLHPKIKLRPFGAAMKAHAFITSSFLSRRTVTKQAT
jgi:hypothetical protein